MLHTHTHRVEERRMTYARCITILVDTNIEHTSEKLYAYARCMYILMAAIVEAKYADHEA